ncbi:MAG: hypothetical protein IKC75_06405 [Clostridia bacterium]|nr:hypothetical protein [Clostridia bacterium]
MKKKIIALLLLVCMLHSTALLFSSCGKKTIDLANDYTVVYGADLSPSASTEVKDVISSLKKKSDQSIYTQKVNADDELEDVDKFEILIGNTNRKETEKARKKIKGSGYIITTVGQKIVIVGTTNFLTMLALEQFVDTYLSGDKISSLEIEEEKLEKTVMLELGKEWKFVYSSYLRGEGDYVNEGIARVLTALEGFSDLKKRQIASITDKESANFEILAGLTERPETKEILSVMDAGNYAVAAKNGKLIVTAFNDDMMRKAFDRFIDILKDSVFVVEDGTKHIVLPSEFSCIYTDQKAAGYITDFPRPEGLALSGTINVHDGSFEYYYEGAGVNGNAYAAYCEKLAKEGYVLKQEHLPKGTDSIFRTYVNETKGIMLYAAYNAFKYAGEQGTGHKPAIRLIVGHLKKAAMVPDKLLTPDFSGKIQNSSITAVQPDYNAGKGQMEIITLENGSFVVIDGNTSSTEARDRIYNTLLDLYKRGHNGNNPSPHDPIRIAAWYCTHSHSDHIGAITNFIKSYCRNYNSYCITIDTLIGNFPSDEGYYNVYLDKSANTTVRDTMAELSLLISDAPGMKAGFEFIKVHTGQRFWIGNVEFEVMFTHEELFPRRLHSYNNSSTVIRTTLYHTENGKISEGSATSALWLGDAQAEACRIMCAMYGSHLDSDMVQVAHHIGSGSEFPIYALAKPTWAWYPCSLSSYLSLLRSSSTVGYQVSHNISSLQYVIVADVCNYTVVIGPGGADPTGVFNAGEAEAVTLGRVDRNSTTGFMRTKYNLS